MTDDLNNRFTYHRVEEATGDVMGVIRAKGLELAELIDSCVLDGREKSLAITKVEESVFWAIASLARHSEEKTEKEEVVFST